MLTPHLEKFLIPLSIKIRNIENLWNKEEIEFFKKYFLNKFKEDVNFLVDKENFKTFVIENGGEWSSLEEIVKYFINNSEKLKEEEKFLYLLFIVKLKFLKYKKEDLKKYENEILSIFKKESFKNLSSLILRSEYFYEKLKEDLSEKFALAIHKKFVDFLKVFHTFYVDVYFEKILLEEDENFLKYLTGFTIPEKYMSKFEKEIQNIRENKEKESLLKNLEIQEKKIIDDLKESLNLEIEDFSKEIRDIVSKKKLNLFLPHIKEKSAKWLRSFGIILRDYNYLQKMKMDYEEKLNIEIPKNILNTLPSPYILIKEWEMAKTIFLKDETKEKKVLQNIFFEYYLHKKKEKKDFEFFEDFIKKVFIGFEMDFEAFEKELSYFFEDKLIPNLISNLLLKSIIIIPEELKNENIKDLSIWIAFKKLPEGDYYIFKDFENLKVSLPFKTSEDFYEKFKETVSCLVYDIRGSTFMSLKLKDSVKEFNIKNEFNKEMVSIVKRYGGFPLKDLGDGGIVLFSANSREIFEEVFEEAFLPKGRALRIPKLFEKEVEIIPSSNSSINAILCARDMYRKSLEFIRENYPKYRDFFPDVVENFPPLKSLFRVGIGIASGKPGKHIYLNYNSFGDIDASGCILNIANLLAKGKNPLNSLIYIDSNTFFSLLLNSSEWDVECESDDIFERIKFYLDKIDEFWVFDFPLKEIKIKIVGTDLLDRPDKEEGLVFQVPPEAEFGNDEELVFKEHPLRLVYEVIPYETK